MGNKREGMLKALNKKTKAITNFDAGCRMPDVGRLQSEVIDFLRFPLIIGILLIHSASTTANLATDHIGNDAWLPIFTICRDFFANTLGRLSVPTFFFISGFLFFLHIDAFDSGVYLKKLKSRVRTLLIPYLFWNILSLMIFHTAYHITALAPFFSQTHDFTWQYFLKALWALPNLTPELLHYPYAYQFWFIRDLMVMVTLSPILYHFVKSFRIASIALLGLLWFSEWWQGWLPWLDGHGLSIVALFFFTAGAWFAINKRNLIDDADKVAKWAFILYPPVAVADMFSKLHIPGQYIYLPFVHNSGILLGMVACFALTAHLLKTGNVKVNTFLASASFFVFAVHEPLFLSKLRKVVFVIFQPQADADFTILYFLLVLVVAVVSLGIYWLLLRVLPGFTRLITHHWRQVKAAVTRNGLNFAHGTVILMWFRPA